MLDLDYLEDSEAGTDSNFVMTGAGALVPRVQGQRRGSTFSRGQFDEMYGPARQEASPAGLVAAQEGGDPC